MQIELNSKHTMTHDGCLCDAVGRSVIKGAGVAIKANRHATASRKKSQHNQPQSTAMTMMATSLQQLSNTCKIYTMSSMSSMSLFSMFLTSLLSPSSLPPPCVCLIFVSLLGATKKYVSHCKAILWFPTIENC